MQETRKQRFTRIAERRVNRVLNDLRLMGNLSNRSSYDYSEFEIRKIFGAIDTASKTAKSKFSFTKKTKFQL